jgi:hypothetical protein
MPSCGDTARGRLGPEVMPLNRVCGDAGKRRLRTTPLNGV